MSIFRGCATALVTPFKDSGVDYQAFRRLVDRQIEGGVSSLVFLGTTGEPPTMTEQERKDVISFAAEYCKSVPMIAGVGCNCTRDTVDMARFAQRAGAKALLVVTPYYNKCTQKGIVAHYTEIANSVDIPVIAYNVPARTGVNILPKTVLELSKVPNIVAIKEASGNISQITEIARLIEGKMDLYSGDDGIVLPLLSLGAKGVISVASNVVPNEMSQLCEQYFKGNHSEALRIQLKLLPLINALFVETNPIPVKTALNLMGQNAGLLRLPLTEMEQQNLDLLKSELSALGLI